MGQDSGGPSGCPLLCVIGHCDTLREMITRPTMSTAMSLSSVLDAAERTGKLNLTAWQGFLAGKATSERPWSSPVLGLGFSPVVA